MKKERLFYLDFIRALATLIIVLTHYNAIFLYTNPQMPEKAVLGLTIGNVFIGDFGVTLFLAISGAALMYVYEERLDWKLFLKKRFLNIYPMYWVAYLLVFLYEFYINQGFNQEIPRYKILYSILGMDMYFSSFGDVNFALVGEWFLGFIVIFYLLFPLLRKWMNSHPVSLGIISTAIFLVYIIFDVKYASISVATLLPRILFGMYLIKYRKKIKLPAAIVSLAVILLNGFLAPDLNSSLQATYVGLSAFVVLVYIADYLKWAPFRKICSLVCKYSYPIFIIHHVVIRYVTANMDLYSITRLYSYLLFLVCCCAIFGAAYILQKINDGIMNLFKEEEY